ncbi:TIGR04222 domain-containing membrane protein [Altererythrobacter xixiisoli]|uniref:TIGR04222 domain-containing membrane protein n=1 Tax=Croceibacterium xixiisoli TaxID=1476466 RepID=A0A6I4TV03_9SPHN|nr:TIGR04222 domain-containing membrane protein [Croceibacterium xixiisoli]MXO99040.1 TIGR04222 domain-containing membrane protein [Croceibacterium xixiisoli]
MNGLNPFEWTGPAFLVLYVVALIIAFGGSVLLSRWLRQDGHRGAAINDDDMAVLTGGRDRLAQTITARLYACGAVRIDRSGIHLPLDWGRHGSAVPNRAALHRDEQDFATWPDLLRATVPFAERVERRLADSGLMMNKADAQGFALQAAFPLMLLIICAILRYAEGVQWDRPTGFLVIFVVTTIVIAIVRVTGYDQRTRAGRDVAMDAQQRGARLKRAPNHDELSTAVSLFGMAVLVGTPFSMLNDFRSAGNSGDGSGATNTDADGDGCGSSGCGGCGGG